MGPFISPDNTLLMNDLRSSGHSSVPIADEEHSLAYDMDAPYDIRIMSCDRYRGILSHQFSIPFQNFSYTTQIQPPHGEHLAEGATVTPARSRVSLPHRHNFFELMFVLSGTVEQYIENGCFQYGKGTVCLMNCNTEHAETSNYDFVSIYLCLSRQFLRRYLPGNIGPQSPLGLFFEDNLRDEPDFKKDYVLFTPQREGETDHFEYLLNTVMQEKILALPGAENIIAGLILRLLDRLQTPAAYALEYNKLDSSVESYLFSKVTQIMERKPGALTREELVQALNYNGDYINRIVKKYSGMSIVHYNRAIRLKRAERLLVESELPITQIIAQLGYENRTHFYRLFEEKYGVTPLAYRQQYGAAG